MTAEERLIQDAAMEFARKNKKLHVPEKYGPEDLARLLALQT